MRKLLALLPILFVLIVGCKPTERVVYQTRTDSVFVVHTDTFTKLVEVVRTDTLRQRDSIYLTEVVQVRVNEAGDTIYRDRIVYRDRWHDAAQSKTESADKQTASVSNALQVEAKTDTIYIKEKAQASLKDKAQSYGGLAIAFLSLIVLLVVSTKKG